MQYFIILLFLKLFLSNKIHTDLITGIIGIELKKKVMFFRIIKWPFRIYYIKQNIDSSIQKRESL